MNQLPMASDSDASAIRPPRSQPPGTRRVRLLVSACLLGEKVRYDGQHKYDSFLVEELGRFVEWEPNLSRVRLRHAHAPALDAPGRRLGLAPAREPHRCRSDRADEALHRGTAARARRRGAVRLRLQEGLAELGHGASQGLRRTGNGRARRCRPLHRRFHAALPARARRRRGALARSRAARGVHRARLLSTPLARPRSRRTILVAG